MKYNNKWFSLIEVIVATSILTIAVFWVFKLIAENSKILANSNNFMQANFLLQPTKECLNKIGLTALFAEWSTVYLDLWNDWITCNIWNSTDLLVLDNIEYKIRADKESSWVDYINWNIIVNSNLNWEVTLEYLQK